MAAPTPPAEAQAVGGVMDAMSPVRTAMYAYEHAAYRRGKTGCDSTAVDAAGERLIEAIAALSAQPQQGEAIAEVPTGHPTSVVKWLGPMPPPGTKLYAQPRPASAPVESEPGAVRSLVAAANAVLTLYPGDELLWSLESAVRPFNATKPAECAVGCPPQQVCDYCQIASLAQQPTPVAPVGVDNPADTASGIDGDWYCERHPWALQGHDGCGGAGLPACARIDMLCHIIRMRDQELRERDQQYGFLADRALAHSSNASESVQAQPAAVDEAMVERFLAALRNTPGNEVLDADEKLARRLLTAALAGKQQGGAE